tara:strand:+ start:26 stop:142 length:117 start_codon:yes stop_codon:yes gene_type:complete
MPIGKNHHVKNVNGIKVIVIDAQFIKNGAKKIVDLQKK